MKKTPEKLMKNIFRITALTTVLAILIICVFLFANGIPAIRQIGLLEFLLGKDWSPGDIPATYGIFPMIVGSIGVTIGSMFFGVPIGLLTAIFMAYYCPKMFYRILKSSIELLAGIPSVVYGFFGLVILVPFVRQTFGGSGNSMLTASILLGIMILPTIIAVSESALRVVPNNYYEGALALGATHEQSIFSVVLPAAKSGVFASIVLGIGRAVGETMAVIMVAGNQARIPTGILKGVRTMTANIVLEMGYATDLHRGALIATGVTLFMFILLINFAFNVVKRRMNNG